VRREWRLRLCAVHARTEHERRLSVERRVLHGTLQRRDALPVLRGLRQLFRRKRLCRKLRGQHGLSRRLRLLARRGSVPTGLPARLQLRQQARV
jgi:hypothetical protein